MISSLPKWVGDLFESSLRPNMKVLSTTYLSPQLKKIRFQGNISKMNLQIGYANVIRVSETDYRNYTVAYYNKKDGVFDIIFHIHGNGVGSNYIDALKTGDVIYISSPRGKKLYDPSVKQQFIFGDETSLGVALSFLPVLIKNQHQFQFLFELEEENKDVPQLLGMTNYKVLLKNDNVKNEKLMSKLHAVDWKTANFVLTGNVKSVQSFRKMIKSSSAGKIISQGYWLEGKKGL